MPIDGKGNWSIAQNAEVERVVGVLPDIFAAEDDIFSESLLQPGVEFVAKARLQRSLPPGGAREQGSQHFVGATLAREHEIFVERRLQGPGIRDAQHSVGGLHAVGNTQARLRLSGAGQAVVQVAAYSQIK